VCYERNPGEECVRRGTLGERVLREEGVIEIPASYVRFTRLAALSLACARISLCDKSSGSSSSSSVGDSLMFGTMVAMVMITRDNKHVTASTPNIQ